MWFVLEGSGESEKASRRLPKLLEDRDDVEAVGLPSSGVAGRGEITLRVVASSFSGGEARWKKSHGNDWSLWTSGPVIFGLCCFRSVLMVVFLLLKGAWMVEKRRSV
jgi:hypothetical protein